MFVSLITAVLFLTAVDPSEIHATAHRASFEVQGYAKREEGKLVFHFRFTAPLTGVCEFFELVDSPDTDDVALPFDEFTVIKGHEHRFALELHSRAELEAANAARSKAYPGAVGVDCQRPGDDAEALLSSIFVLR